MWITEFLFENSIRTQLVERLLQLVFLIRINHKDFSEDLSALLTEFQKESDTFNISLSTKWSNLIKTQIPNPNSMAPCEQFVTMLQSFGDTCCQLRR
jgi:hypothetical protein